MWIILQRHEILKLKLMMLRSIISKAFFRFNVHTELIISERDRIQKEDLLKSQLMRPSFSFESQEISPFEVCEGSTNIRLDAFVPLMEHKPKEVDEHVIKLSLELLPVVVEITEGPIEVVFPVISSPVMLHLPNHSGVCLMEVVDQLVPFLFFWTTSLWFFTCVD